MVKIQFFGNFSGNFVGNFRKKRNFLLKFPFEKKRTYTISNFFLKSPTLVCLTVSWGTLVSVIFCVGGTIVFDTAICVGGAAFFIMLFGNNCVGFCRTFVGGFCSSAFESVELESSAVFSFSGFFRVIFRFLRIFFSRPRKTTSFLGAAGFEEISATGNFNFGTVRICDFFVDRR